MFTLIKIMLLMLDVALWILIAYVLLSWLISFGVLNMRQPFVSQVWDGLNRLLQPIFDKIRRYLPDTGALDLAPLVVFIAIYILRIILVDIAVAVA